MNVLADTYLHILNVSNIIGNFISKLTTRQAEHDLSKIQAPEWEVFEKVTPRLKELSYGSAAYKKSLADMGPALEHHYANNRHHPEFHEGNGPTVPS